MKRIILDTDIGSDVDDALALAFCLKSKEIKLEGITTVYGDSELRAKIALKELQIFDVKDVPVRVGESRPFTERKKVWMTSREGRDIITQKEKFKIIKESAIDFLIAKIEENKKKIILVCIGPLTNIAKMLQKKPNIGNYIKEVVLMGGFLTPIVRFTEHNFRSDPVATKKLFETKIPITMIPLNITLKTFLTKKEINLIKSSKKPELKFLSVMMKDWIDFIHKRRSFQSLFTHEVYLHDPLTVGYVIDKTFLKTKKMNILIDNKGKTTVSKGGKEVNVAVDVDVNRFKKYFLKVLDVIPC